MEPIDSFVIVLESERLTLRGQLASDVPFLVDLWSDPEVTRYMGGPRDRAYLQSVFEEIAQDPFGEPYDMYPLIEKASGQRVGYCGLLDKEVDGRTEIELNYVVIPAAQGRGYATEIGRAIQQHAFETLGLQRLVALIDPENVASQRVALKLGMSLERKVDRPGGFVRQVYAVERAELREVAL